MKFKTIAGATALAVAGALIVAPAAWAEEVFPETPVVETIAEQPIVEATPVEETPVAEEEVIEPAPETVQEAVTLETQTVIQPTSEVFWLVPEGVEVVDNVVGAEGFPQAYLADQIVPCERVAQVDTYPVSAIPGLIADGWLTNGEDHSVVISWRWVYGGECPPPVTNTVCETTTPGPVSTDLVDLWGNVDTRSKGHVEYVEGALHVWTEDNSSQSKVSEGIAVNVPLREVGQLGIDATANQALYPYGPGLNLFLDITGDGVADGTLVYETVYGQDLWVTNGSAQALKDASTHTGGNGSENHGTIDHYLTTFPDATVVGLAYSLGSGVHGDWNINSITFGCTEYTFDKVDELTVPEPKEDVTVQVTYTNWTPLPTCENQEVEQTRDVTTTTTTVTTTYTQEVSEGGYVLVEHVSEPDVDVVTVTETQHASFDGPACPVTVVEEPPSEDKLAYTGSDDLNLLPGALGLLGIGALLAGAVALRRFVLDRKQV